jgi:hypothetical protein
MTYLDDPIIIQVGYQYLNINKKFKQKKLFYNFWKKTM